MQVEVTVLGQRMLILRHLANNDQPPAKSFVDRVAGLAKWVPWLAPKAEAYNRWVLPDVSDARVEEAQEVVRAQKAHWAAVAAEAAAEGGSIAIARSGSTGKRARV